MTDFDYVVPIDADFAVHVCSVQEEGMVAAVCDCKLRHNPYPEDSNLWQEWNDGYFLACPRRGESEEDELRREMGNEFYIAELKDEGKWEYIKPTTPDERAKWATDPNPPMPTALRRWYAKQKQKQR